MTAGNHQAHPFRVTYPDDVEQAIAVLEPVVGAKLKGALNSRWVSLKLLDYDDSLINELNTYLGTDILQDDEIQVATREATERIRGVPLRTRSYPASYLQRRTFAGRQ